ncbi:MAG: DUF2849 domain-containing protein [Pseudomonadota bacterium]
MAKAFMPVVFAANDLIEGDSVYLGPEGWVRDVRAASVAETADAVPALETRAAQGVAGNIVVGPYAVAIAQEATGPWPVLRREQIKASRGTTIPVGPAAAIADAA